MKLREALAQTRAAHKHVDGPEEAGTYDVSKANLSAGYYEDFKADDPKRRLDISTSTYWGFDYPGADPLTKIESFAGEDDWTPGHSWTNRGGGAA